MSCSGAARSMQDRYREAQAAAAEKYGPDTVVAYMVGGFYEFYGEQAAIANRVAGLHYTRVKGTTGFPVNSLAHMCTKFTDAGYVMVVMDQYSFKKPNGVTEIDREVTAVYGPGAPIDVPAGCDSTACAVIYLAGNEGSGYASLQTNTGKTSAAQFDEGACFGSLVGAALADNPMHTLVVFPDTDQGRERSADFEKRVGRMRVFGKLVTHKAVDPVTLTDSHVMETLRRQFSGCGMLTDAADVFAGIGGRSLAARAFVHLVHFVYRKDDSALHMIEPPTLLTSSEYMDVAIGGLRQLDVVKEDGCGLLAHLPKPCTAPGRRAFRERLCRPSRDPAVISARYDTVDSVKSECAQIRRVLSGVADVEHIHRNMLKPAAFRPGTWWTLIDSVRRIASVSKNPDYGSHPADDVESCVRSIIRIPETVAADHPVFVRGYDEELDALTDHLSKYTDELEALVSHLNHCAGCVPGGDKHFKISDPNKDGDIQIITTQKRFENAKREMRRRKAEFRIADSPLFSAADLSVRVAGSKTLRVVHHEFLDEGLATMAETRRETDARRNRAHADACADIHRDIRESVMACVRDLQEVDVACAVAVAAVQRGFVRPQMIEDSAPFVSAVKLRHPIVEDMDNRSEYVGNDVGLDQSGMLLFGINGSGKSCLMKSLGLAVVMAQAGMFVSADSFAYSPYAKLFTRIWNNDDIGRGLSSFTVEMTELNEILRRGDRESLVLGDELCSGTERVSATSIIAAGVRKLSAIGCAFLLATHQHDVVPIVRDVPDLQVRHLSVYTESGNLIYERMLRDGSGDTHYGVTVCRALGMPSDFVEDATREMRRITGADADYMVPRKKSNYNASVYMGMCSRCGKRAAEHTHHRVPQSTAARRVKNAAHNLERLCEACHVEHHANEATNVPQKAVQTSSGVAYIPVDIA
nr:DNA mismatch repair ATPase MutS subfamily 7 [Oceanusvirus sp.]